MRPLDVANPRRIYDAPVTIGEDRGISSERSSLWSEYVLAQALGATVEFTSLANGVCDTERERATPLKLRRAI